jgi:hypothetical protein
MSDAVVIRTERGWAGHFIAAESCSFRRNTLLERGEQRVVVSTVGCYRGPSDRIESIGFERYYETMVFRAKWDDPYWEADVSQRLSFDSRWAIDRVDWQSDADANAMHEGVVEEMSAKLAAGQ